MGVSVSKMASFAATVAQMPEGQLEKLVQAYKSRRKTDDHKEISQFEMDDRIAFVDEAGREYSGIVDKLNKRTVRVRMDDGELIRVERDHILGLKSKSDRKDEWVEVRS
jgi:hypothetical protein